MRERGKKEHSLSLFVSRKGKRKGDETKSPTLLTTEREEKGDRREKEIEALIIIKGKEKKEAGS